MAMTTITARIGRTRLLLLIFGAIATAVIAYSMIGTVSASHDPCFNITPPPHAALDCLDIERQVAAEGYAEAARMASPPVCIFASLCIGFLADREADIDQHLPEFRPNGFGIGMPYTWAYQEVLDAAIAAHLALPEHHGPPPAPPSGGDGDDDGDDRGNDDGDDRDNDDGDDRDNDGDNDEDDDGDDGDDDGDDGDDDGDNDEDD